MGELEKTVAIVFKRKGKSMLSEREFINTLLFDLRWSDPGKSPKISAVDAQKILDASLKAGLLTIQEGALKPTFDYRSIEIPLNYLPSKAALEGAPSAPAQEPAAIKVSGVDVTTSTSKPIDQPNPKPAPVKQPVVPEKEDLDVPLFAVLIEEISRETGMGRRDFVARVNKLAERLKVAPEVAALLVARDSGMDISKYFRSAKEEIIKQ